MWFNTPSFWFQPPGLYAYALFPLGALYGLVAKRRMQKSSGFYASVPVLCIGNYTMGGSGKTPVALALAKAAKLQGLRPGFLTRGYAGSFVGPHQVDKDKDCAEQVGDEALLLSGCAMTVVAKDRAKGAHFLQELGCNFIIMDDGFQSRRVIADYNLIVVDCCTGFGNGYVFPAGPLRSPLAIQRHYTDAMLLLNADHDRSFVKKVIEKIQKPALFAKPVSFAKEQLEGKALFAFCGIGHPQRFFHALEAMGGLIKDTRLYPDHYPFSSSDLISLYQEAQKKGLTLATTAKDYKRFVHLKAKSAAPCLAAFFSDLIIADVKIVFEEKNTEQKILKAAQQAFEERSAKIAA